MNYRDGQAVQLGDKVRLGDDQSGVVVAVIEAGEYASGYRASDWQYLGNGLIVSTDFGDVRFDEPDEDMALVDRLEYRVSHRQ
jgi:hypothetical protein